MPKTYKNYEVTIAYCQSYETDTFEVKARSEKEAIKKAWEKGLSYDCEAVLWEYANPIKVEKKG
jgi:hypothetical protein